MNKFIKSTLAILTAIPFSTYAENTQESALSGFYVSAFMTQSSLDISRTKKGFYEVERDYDDSHSGYKLVAGYQFHQNFSLELAYIDIGETGFSGATPEELDNGVYLHTGQYGGLEFGDFTLAAVGQYEVAKKTNVYAKLGVFTWDISEGIYEYTASGSTPQVFSNNPSTSSGTNIFVGLGAKYDFDYISVLGDVEVYNVNGDYSSVLSVGVSYAF